MSGRHVNIATITPDDNQYPDFVRGVNQRFTGQPAAIYLPRTSAEICALVEHLVQQQRRFVVRSSGHCLEDFVYNDEVEAIIDLAHFNYVRFDQAVGAFEVGTATPILDLYEELYRRWGVTFPAGICYSVTPGGHVTGGGWGMLCRQLGLTVDYVAQIEVIVVDGRGRARRVIATDQPSDPHRDLWWAHLGGGGGTFGIVTRFWLRKMHPAVPSRPEEALPQPPSHVYLSAISFQWDEIDEAGFAALLGAYTDYFAEHSTPDDPHRDLASFLVLTHRSSGALALVTQVDGTDKEAGAQRMEEYLGRFTRALGSGTSLGQPLGELQEFQKLANLAKPQRLPWLEATKKLGTTNANLTDPSLRQVYKSAYMRASFSDDQVRSLYESLTEPLDVPGASITLSSYGGQVNAVSSDATAYPHRSSAYKLMWMSLWSEAADDYMYIEWNRRCYESLYVHSGGVPAPDGNADGCYINYPDRDLSDPMHNRSDWSWEQLYWKGNYARLQSVKDRYDPTNVFRHRLSVRPSRVSEPAADDQ